MIEQLWEVLGSDWPTYFQPAAEAVLEGRSPYTVDGFVSPPWTAWVLVPLVWVPGWMMALAPIVTLIGLMIYSRKYWTLPIVGISLSLWIAVLYGNIDWIVFVVVWLVGGWIGPIFSAMKPQVGFFAIVADLKNAGTWRNRILLLLPVTAFTIIFTLIYPNWISIMLGHRDVEWNISPFPYLVPVGLFLVYWTWRTGERFWGVMATMCLAPYYSLLGVVFTLYIIAERHPYVGIAASLATWVFLPMFANPS